MRTLVTLLPAVNNLYDLGLNTPQVEKVQKLSTYVSDWQQESWEGSFWHLTLTDKILVYKEFDDTHVNLYKLPDDDQTPSPIVEELQKQKLTNCYFYTPTNQYIFEKCQTGIFFKSFEMRDISILKQFDFLYNLAVQRNSKSSGFRTLTNPQAGLQFAKKYLLKDLESFNMSNHLGLSDACIKVLGPLLLQLWPNMKQTICTEKQITQKQRSLLQQHDEMTLIVYVGEVENHRFVIVRHGTSSSYYYSSRRYEENHSFYIIPHTHPMYDYCDIGRFLYDDRTSYNTCMAKYIFLDNEPAIPKQAEILKECGRSKNIRKEQFGIFTNADITQAVKHFMQRETRLERESSAQKRLQQKVEEKVLVLKDQKGQLKVNDMDFTYDSIEYQGQHLKLNTDSVAQFSNWTYLLLKSLVRYQNITDIHFDTVIQSFVQYLTSVAVDLNTNVAGQIGDVNFNLECKQSTNVKGSISTRWYMNTYRINTVELEPVLERALCFTNQVDFDKFLKSVSTCSLFFHRYLQLGLDIAVKDSFDHTNIVMKFPLERKKGKMYLVLDDKEFAIADTHKLIRLSNKQNIMDVVTTLLDGSAVHNVEADDIKQIIQEGKQAYTAAIEKSKVLLQETEELFGIQPESLEIGGKSKFGYKIKGKIRTYFLEKDTEIDDNGQTRGCGVYDYHSGQYICIVDKSTSQVGQDKLVNRIFALHNDSRVAQHINTLQTRTE